MATRKAAAAKPKGDRSHKHHLTYNIEGLPPREWTWEKFPTLAYLEADAWAWCDSHPNEDVRKQRRITMDAETIDFLIRYTIYTHDHGTAYLAEENLVRRRQQVVSDLIEWGCRFPPQQIEALVHGHHELATRLALLFLKNLPGKSRELALFLALESAYWDDVEAIMAPLPVEGDKAFAERLKRSDLRVKMNAAKAQLDDVARKVFSGDDSVMALVLNRPNTVTDALLVENPFANSSLTNPTR
jgi:hypothetical protein